MSLIRKNNIQGLIFLIPFFLYEDLLIAAILFLGGFLLLKREKISIQLAQLEWREYLFFLYTFHMLFGERDFAYVGFEPLFVTEIVLAILTYSYAKDLFRIRKELFVYYLLVLIGFGYAFVYFFHFGLDAIRDSFMLLYAFWVPIVYHIFKNEKHYDLFFSFLKLFIVLKAIAYFHESLMIVLGYQRLTFEGFRFGVGYILPSLIVMSIFLPFKRIGFKYKILSLVMIPAVFTVFHRSIFVGIMLGVIVIFLLGHRESRNNILRYGVTSLALLVAFLLYYNTLVDVDLFDILQRKTSFEEGNINYRLMSWDYVMDKFYEFFLLGFGVGKPIMYASENIFYSTINLTYFQIRDLAGNAQPHNSYINILARFGILIFPIFLYAIFKPLFNIAKYKRLRGKNGFETYSRFLLLVGFLMLMYILAFFNVVLEGPHHSFPFWLVIGMLLNFERAGNFSPQTVKIIR